MYSYSDETLQAMIKRIEWASYLDVIESVEKNAKIIAELLVSKDFLRALSANPDNNAVESILSLPGGLQDANSLLHAAVLRAYED